MASKSYGSVDGDRYRERARMSCISMSNKDAATRSEAASQAAAVELTKSDIFGVCLDEPMDHHTMPQLKLWLMCRGIKAPSSWKKENLVDR